jgi:exodeoxyribonuclease V alpha subunit
VLKVTAPIGPTRETLVGSVERVTLHNEENGFAVLKVRRAEGAISWLLSATRLRSPAGEFIHAVGVWFTDRTHGLQFKADLLKTTPPTTTEGIEKYLGSGMTRGIGPKLAKRIVGIFGEATFEIIEASPEKLREVPGIGEFRAGKIAAAWAEQKAVRDIKGIGFRTADAIAMKIDMTREAPQRVRAGISFPPQETTDEGHCALPVETLVELAIKLLDIDKTLVGSALDHELAQGEVVAEAIGKGPSVFLRGLFLAERGIAERLFSLARASSPWPAIDIEKAIPWVERKTGKTLAASQRTALGMVLGTKVAVLTGGPGVGKTTLLDAICRILSAKAMKILLGAPTGRAAKRMSEQTGIEAKTLHRLLELDPLHGGFKRNAEYPLDCDLLVIDETSMVDVSLMLAVLKSIPSRAALLLVGAAPNIRPSSSPLRRSITPCWPESSPTPQLHAGTASSVNAGRCRSR